MINLLFFIAWLLGIIISYLWIRKCNPELVALEADSFGRRLFERDSDGRIPKDAAIGISIVWPFTLVLQEGGYRVLRYIGSRIFRVLEWMVSKLP